MFHQIVVTYRKFYILEVLYIGKMKALITFQIESDKKDLVRKHAAKDGLDMSSFSRHCVMKVINKMELEESKLTGQVNCKMDFVSYLNSYVHITLLDDFYYIGKVVEADVDGLTVIDKTGKRVSLSNKSISTIREIKNA